MNCNQKLVATKEECKSFMSEKDLALNSDLIIDGIIHRYSKNGNKAKQSEWYVAHEGVSSKGNAYLNVRFGSWKEDSKYTFSSFNNDPLLNNGEVKELREKARLDKLKADHEIKECHIRAAEDAKKLWASYATKPPTDASLRYINSKGIHTFDGIRFGLNPNGYSSMAIPLVNTQGNLRSLQYISCDTNNKPYKTFLKEAAIRGHFHIIGSITKESGRIFFVEGYATGASVFEAINEPVVVCFGTSNIIPVMENFKKKYPQVLFIIAADNDKPGKNKATDASTAFGCRVIIPLFPKEMESKGYSDFNDLHQACGIKIVKKQLIEKKFIHIKEFIKAIIDTTAQKTLASSHISANRKPCETFKLSNLPLALNEYISFLCKGTKAHPIMITSSVLTMVSAYLGTKVYLKEGQYFQDLYPNLWILCIAKSGQFKTTALNKGAKIAYENQSDTFKNIKELKRMALEDDKNFDSNILEESRKNIILPTKITAEGFLEYLSEGHQGAVYASEFGGWLQNLDKNHNNDFKAILTEFYDIPTYYRYKTKTQGDCIIQRPFMSICGVSTMPWIQANIKPTDVPSGFFARFLIFTPPYQDNVPPALPSENSNSSRPPEEINFKAHIDSILSKIGDSRKYSLTSEARKLFTEYHEAIYDESKLYGDRAQEILQPYLKRWSPYLLKLAILMQIFIDIDTDSISEKAIRIAYNILLPAMKSTAMLLENELGESDHQRKCRILFEWICSKIKNSGNPVKRQTIMSSRKLDGGSKEYDYVLQTLIDQGRIEYKEKLLKNDSEYILIEKVENN